MTYVKCRWDECRYGEGSEWGCSWWYFEFGPDGRVTRHVEVYDGGVRLRYGPDHLMDQFGRLAEASRQKMDMPGPVELSPEEFEAAWASAKTNMADH